MPGTTSRKERRRSGGEGSVYETSDGWRGAVSWTDDDGTRHRRVVRGTTSQAVRGKLDELRRELKLGTLTPAGTGTVAEYLSEWLQRERTRIRPSTWREREQHVRGYLIPSFGKLSLARLTPIQIERAMARFVSGGRPKDGETLRGGRPPRPVSPVTVSTTTPNSVAGTASRSRGPPRPGPSILPGRSRRERAVGVVRARRPDRGPTAARPGPSLASSDRSRPTPGSATASPKARRDPANTSSLASG